MGLMAMNSNSDRVPQSASEHGELAMQLVTAPLTRASLVKPMRHATVPSVDARYWTAICLASVLGCNLGDFVSLYLHWGHWRGLLPLALVFGALIAGERRSALSTEAWYWSVVIVLRTAATNLADLATHTLQWPYAWVIAALEMLQVLVILPVPPRLRVKGSEHSSRPATDGWYWLSLLTAGTLGTAAGDCAADEFHLGTGGATLVLGVVFAALLAIGRRSRWSAKAEYWLVIIAARAAGTTAGDWLAFREHPGLGNGLGLGLPVSTVLSAALFIGMLRLWRDSAPSERGVGA